MLTHNLSQKIALDSLIAFIEAEGPEENQYDELSALWDVIDMEKNGDTKSTRDEVMGLFGPEFLGQTMQGLSYRKPHGYSGDFEIIDLIYQRKINSDRRFVKWDKYFQAHAAPNAVRNRKEYFIKLVLQKASGRRSPLRILNIASGPCRDILELLEQVPSDKVRIDCIEMDPQAIDYAKNLLGRFSDDVHFTQRNIFKFNTDEKYDLIWSAGLFDYFNDDAFVQILSRMRSWSAPSGEIVIGNFSVCNPSRSYMENAGNWYLFHRTDSSLKQLAERSGLSNGGIEVRTEPLKVNLFLHANVSSDLKAA